MVAAGPVRSAPWYVGGKNLQRHRVLNSYPTGPNNAPLLLLCECPWRVNALSSSLRSHRGVPIARSSVWF